MEKILNKKIKQGSYNYKHDDKAVPLTLTTGKLDKNT